jgi:hypothetical protein
MKKLTLLTLTMILSLIAFSQKDTIIPTKCFPAPIVKLIAKDLISGDQAKEELKLTLKELEETQLKVSLKDSIILKMNEKEVNYNRVISEQTKQYAILQTHSTEVEKSLKAMRSRNIFTKVFSTMIIGTLTYFIITK